MKNLSLALAAAASLFIGGSTLTANEASADVRVRIGGRAHVRVGGPRVVVRPYWRYHRVRRPVVYVGGHIWLGGGYYYERPFAQPPPPPPPADCNCGGYYGPIAPAPATYVTAPVVAQPELPRWGFGVFMGGVSVDGEHEGEDLGFVGQFRLTRGLILEGEIAKNTLEDGGRVDRRLMAGLTYEIGAERRWAPYLTAGLGSTQVEVEGGWHDSQAIGEIGAGLRWRLAPRISLFGDMRLGSRESVDGGNDIGTAPPEGSTARTLIPEDEESYSRVRLGAMLTF